MCDCPVWLGLGNRMVSLLLAKGRMLAVWSFVQDLRLLPFFFFQFLKRGIIILPETGIC